jgi:hypothetical protein
MPNKAAKSSVVRSRWRLSLHCTTEALTGGLKVFLADDAAGSSAVRERIREEILRRLDISILKQVFVALSAERH